MKRPSFQFYPADWLRDTALRSCSIGARGLWIDMICFMHEGNPYGHLKVGNKVILAANLCGMVGATLSEIEGWLDELKQAGVFDIAEDGSMCSRRMIKDENLRNMRAAGGRLGGNPALKDMHKVNLKDKQKPTPSSSSSSSSSIKEIQAPATRSPTIQKPDDVEQQTWDDWCQLRKAKKATVTHTVVNGARKEAALAGMSLEDFLQVWCRRGSQGLEASWLRPDERNTAKPQPKSFAQQEREAGWARWEEQTNRIHPDRIKAEQQSGQVIDVTPKPLEILQ